MCVKVFSVACQRHIMVQNCCGTNSLTITLSFMDQFEVHMNNKVSVRIVPALVSYFVGNEYESSGGRSAT